MVGLHHRRQEVGHGGARGRDDGDGPTRPHRQAECEEARGALVDAHVQPQVTRAIGGKGRKGERRRPGPGGEDEITDPGVAHRAQHCDGALVGRDRHLIGH